MNHSLANVLGCDADDKDDYYYYYSDDDDNENDYWSKRKSLHVMLNRVIVLSQSQATILIMNL